MQIRHSFLVLALLGASLPAWAADNSGGQRQPPSSQGGGQQQGQRGGRPHRMPPPEAFTACANQQQGASITFTTPRGDKVEATCEMMEGRLFARPNQPPPDMPPEEGQGQGGRPQG